MDLLNNTKWILTCLVALTLTGCGGSGGGNTTPSPQDPNAPETQEPAIKKAPKLTSLSTSSRANESLNFTLITEDAENDNLLFSSNSLPSWLTLNKQTGELSGTPTMQHLGENKISLTISDGVHNPNFTFTINVVDSWFEESLRTGDASLIENKNSYIEAALADIEANKTRFTNLKKQLFNLDANTQKLTAIDWTPTHDAATLTAQYPFNEAVLYSTHSAQTGGIDRVLPLAIAGSKHADIGRYLAFGGNPFRNTKNEQMDQFLINSLSWLSDKNLPTTDTLKVVFSQLDESYYFKDRSLTRAWFDAQFSDKVTYNNAGECDGSALVTCLADKPDVIIISRVTRSEDDKTAILKAVESALAQDIAVIYLQHDGGIGEHGRALLNILNISHANDNYWWKLYLSAFDPQSIENQLPTDITAIKKLLTNFKNQQFNVDLSACDTRSCPTESQVQSEFFDGAQAIQKYFKNYDINKQDIFASESYRLQKTLILLADKFRQQVSYPMDKLTTNNVRFFESLYADHVVYNYRDINPVQADMGNFSRTDFKHITPENALIKLTSKPNFRSAGVYALPGQTLTVKRTDNSAVVTKMFINSLRSSATHIFSENKYNRPYFLQSQAIEIKPGESIKFTSSYGGPVQISFDKKDLAVSFEFTNIGRHPHWSSPADDVMFAFRMGSADYDWAEIATPGFEVHSKLSKLNNSLTGSIWPIASDFANATARYTHNKVHVLAGFQGPGIDVEPEIHDFVTTRGLSVETIDIVKHMNADQPTCGWGCSGNPYDAGWDFSPVGHGDIHELGHGIERDSMRFEGYGGHSNTNFYSYFAKSIYEDETGQSASCQSLPFETIFNTLQQSKLEADAAAYMQANLTKSWSEHHAIYIQLMMAAQAQGSLKNGWFLYPRLHIWDREFNRADNNEDSWNATKAGLGFGNYTLEAFKNSAKNDRLFIALSEITQLDLTDWFAMYGFSVTDKAIQQIKNKNYKLLAQQFYASTGTGYCSSLIQDAVTIDGLQVWPSN